MSIVPEEISQAPEERMATPKQVAYVISDVHLSTSQLRVKSTQNILAFLEKLNRENMAHQKTLLILNGDIFDLTGSWHGGCLPWDPHTDKVEQHLLALLDRLFELYPDIIEALRVFLANQGELVYIIGNHDRLIGLYPQAQAFIRSTLCPNGCPDINLTFCDRVELTDLGLYVEHGQRFDPFNVARYKAFPPVGDVINILIINRFVDLVLEKLQHQGFSLDTLQEVQGVLEQIEYLRPLSLGPYWLSSISTQFRTHPENQGKAKSIDHIIQEVVHETLLDKRLVDTIAQTFSLSAVLLKSMLYLLLKCPMLLAMLSFVVSLLLHRTRTNRYQVQMAIETVRRTGLHFVSFGHTHIPSLEPISEHDYYFNTGCWKPIIHLFKHPRQFLFEKTPFNRIERSGIFRLEKDPGQPDLPFYFSLVTIQDGHF